MLLLSAKADDAAASVPFTTARSAAMRMPIAPVLKDKVALEGGLDPWVILDCDSRRLRGNVDIPAHLNDVPDIRAWLCREGLYDVMLDSRKLPCNKGFGDFRTYTTIDGVLVGFCPYYFAGDEPHWRNVTLMMTDGFEALLKAVMLGIVEADFALPGGGYDLPDVSLIGCAVLKSVRIAKVASAHEKDAHDVAEMIESDATMFVTRGFPQHSLPCASIT